MNHELTETLSKEVFKALVEAQDGGMSVPASKAAVARQFNLTDQEISLVERQGLDFQWPPLA
jgi:hypothetical protein